MRIETGASETHPSVLPIDIAATPATAAPTPAFPAGSGQGGVRDLTGERLSQLTASEGECAAAQSYGMSADGARRQHYQLAMSPLGASATDEMSLPVVPANVIPAEGSGLYRFSGDEPVA